MSKIRSKYRFRNSSAFTTCPPVFLRKYGDKWKKRASFCRFLAKIMVTGSSKFAQYRRNFDTISSQFRRCESKRLRKALLCFLSQCHIWTKKVSSRKKTNVSLRASHCLCPDWLRMSVDSAFFLILISGKSRRVYENSTLPKELFSTISTLDTASNANGCYNRSDERVWWNESSR